MLLRGPASCLLLSWTLHGAAAAVYQLLPDSTATGTPDLTLPSGSDTLCAIRCAGLASCGGYSRDAAGSCRLYRGASFHSSGHGGEPGRRNYELKGEANIQWYIVSIVRFFSQGFTVRVVFENKTSLTH